jgi:LPPG:FO 2-phospho-L-lactate transferase
VRRAVVLAGGTGGAKLAAGMQDVLGDGLSVIANTADDIEIAGVDVSPDPDLVTYWLSGEIDEERGWGIKDDSFTVFNRLVKLGTPDWFRLSDRDLATCLYRKEFIAEGGRRTDAQAQIARALGVRAAVLPMSEDPVRTRVKTAEGWRSLQQYLVAEHAQAPIAASTAPVIAVSPYVAGQVVKGPTDLFMRAVGRPSTAAGAASLYEGLLDGMICDPEDPDPPPETARVMSCPTLMAGAAGRRELAERTLEFASTLAGQA